jgi:mannose-6-phosphate isomerase-like protein (cupin superfamily)
MTMIVTADKGLRFEDGPDRARIIVSGADTAGRYSLMEWVVAAARATPGAPDYGAHLHRECEETFLIRRGSLEFLIGDEVRTLGPGDFVRAPPGVRHGYRNVSGEEVEMLVSFVPAGLEMLFVKYRTDAPGAQEGDGFVADATRLFASEFGL